LVLRRARSPRDLPDRDRRPGRATGRTVREADRMSRRPSRAAVVVGSAVAIVVLALFPKLAQPYYVTLVLPAFAYAIALLGFNLTRGGTGIRVLRPSLLGQDFKALDKTAFLIGPFYYACLVLAVVLALVMWRVVHSPFGLHLAAIRENPRKAEYLGVRVHRFRLLAFLISAFYGAVGGAILA